MAERFRVPVVVTGPEPLDLLDGIARAVRQLEIGSHMVENQYARAVRPDGNPQARAAIASVFEPAEVEWRGLGRLPGLGPETPRAGSAGSTPPRGFPTHSRRSQRPPSALTATSSPAASKPFECPAFGTRCTPDHPLGAAMVSAEGTCAAYYRYRRSPGLAPATPSLAVLPAQVAPGG